MSLSTASRFDVSSLPGFVSVALVSLPAVPSFTTAREYADWAYDCGREGIDLGPVHKLPHSFHAAVQGGYKAGKEDASEEGRTALAWNLGRHAGVRGRRPRMPREYGRDQAEAYREGWQAGDAERQDWLRGYHGADNDQQPDPFDVEVMTLSENEFREVSEGFTRYPDEEAVEVFGARAYRVEM